MDLKRLLRANKIAAAFYSEQLNGCKEAKEYILNRTPEEIIRFFHLGYASGDGLIDRLNKYDVSSEEAEIIGVIKTNDESYAHEVFVDRIVFPIIHAGMIVGFGGRALGPSNGYKYINSKTSPLYDKQEVLYGLWYSRRYINETRIAIVMEGYLDFLSTFSYGVRNGIAVCGTAFTSKHARNLRRWADNVVLLFDGDKAGREAIVKAKEACINENLSVRAVELPEGMDPDNFVRAYGKEGLLKFIG